MSSSSANSRNQNDIGHLRPYTHACCCLSPMERPAIRLDGIMRQFDDISRSSTNRLRLIRNSERPPEALRLERFRRRRRDLIKPQVSEEALKSMQLEIFNGEESGVEDCSICLERFTDGDSLKRLPCQHRFHALCLDPWIRIRRNCPCCRRVIFIKTKVMKTTQCSLRI